MQPNHAVSFHVPYAGPVLLSMLGGRQRNTRRARHAVSERFPDANITIDDKIVTDLNSTYAILNQRELLTIRYGKGAVRVPASSRLPWYLSHEGNFQRLGSLTVPVVYVDSFKGFPDELSLMDEYSSGDQMRADMLERYGDIPDMHPLIGYLIAEFDVDRRKLQSFNGLNRDMTFRPCY
jgi:hypothetical protein